MNIFKIAKQIFAYSNYIKKLYTLLLKQFLDNTVPFVLNGITNVEFNATKYQSLDVSDKNKLNDCITQALNYIEQNINEITDNINQKNWIVQNYIDGHYIPDEDNQKFIQYLAYFNKFKNKKDFLKQDIKQFKNFGQLYNYIQPFKIKQNVSQFADTLPLVASCGNIKIYKVTQFNQAKILFKDTGWCVKGRGHFNDYGAPYYDVFQDSIQYALIHFNSQQCKAVNNDVFEGDQLEPNFYNALMQLFKKQNNGNVICTGDFENLAPYYIPFLDDSFNGIDVDYIANMLIDNYNWNGISSVVDKLGTKFNQVLTVKTIQNLQDTLQYQIGQKRGYIDTDIQNLLYNMLDNGIQFSYPIQFAYIICQKDCVETWKKYNRLQQNFQFDQNYDEMICNTSSILDYQVHENNFKIPIWLINVRNGVDCSYFIKNDLIEEIIDADSARQFVDYFMIDTKYELQQFSYKIENLITDNQKLQLFYNEIKRRVDKINFDQLPNLPGLFDQEK